MKPDQSFVQTAAMLFIGAVGVIAVGVQSAMFGALERAGRIGVTEIGLAASAEMVALAVGVVLAGKLARHMNLPFLAFLGATGLVFANLAMFYSTGPALIAIRIVAGFSGGILLWLANAYIVVARRVVQLAALFLILQTAVQFSVAAGAAAFAPGNADAIPLVMAGCGVVAFIVSPAASGWAALPEDHGHSPPGSFDVRGITALALMILMQFSLVGGWILVELVGGAANLSTGTIAAATPLMLAAQVVGGLTAMTMSKRLSWSAALFGVGGLLAVVQVLLGLTTTAIPFLATAFAYGLLWNFSLPQLTVMALAADPTLRVARIGPAAVVAGAALGPLASAGLAERTSPALATMVFLLPSLAISFTAILLSNRLNFTTLDDVA